jgi:hypothetical protein
MIVYHSTTTDKGIAVHSALINGLVYVPYNEDESYVQKRAKHFENRLKEPEYRVQSETFKI